MAELAAIGLPDDQTGERVVAVVVPADPADPPTLDELCTHLRAEGLNPRKLPVQIEYVDALPRNAMFKVVKKQLKEQFLPSGGVAMTLPELSTLLYDVSDHVATITLNRPDRLNSFTQTMVEEFDAVWREVREDDDVHCVVLRAAGERAFCTGMDVQEGPWWSDVSVFHQEDPGAILGPKTQKVWKPVIAAVHGMAAGGAFYFPQRGRHRDLLGRRHLLRPARQRRHRLGPRADRHAGPQRPPSAMCCGWALLGNEERLTAATALRLGIVSEIVAREQLWEHAQLLAAEIAGRRPLAVQGTVRAIWESLDLPPTLAKRMGMAYPQLGNRGGGPQHPAERPKPRFR